MKTLKITELELSILISIIEEHDENIGTMDCDDDIKERRKEINAMNRFLKRNKL